MAIDAETVSTKLQAILNRGRAIGDGVASRFVSHILHEARGRGYRRLSLETGSGEGFAPARALYEGHGFQFCGPFAGYAPDPHSVFMTLALESDKAAFGETG